MRGRLFYLREREFDTFSRRGAFAHINIRGFGRAQIANVHIPVAWAVRRVLVLQPRHASQVAAGACQQLPRHRGQERVLAAGLDPEPDRCAAPGSHRAVPTPTKNHSCLREHNPKVSSINIIYYMYGAEQNETLLRFCAVFSFETQTARLPRQAPDKNARKNSPINYEKNPTVAFSAGAGEDGGVQMPTDAAVVAAMDGMFPPGTPWRWGADFM